MHRISDLKVGRYFQNSQGLSYLAFAVLERDEAFYTHPQDDTAHYYRIRLNYKR